MLAAADEFEVLAENELPLPDAAADGEPADTAVGGGGPPGAGGYAGPFVYGAAPIHGGFLLRTETRLYRVGAPD